MGFGEVLLLALLFIYAQIPVLILPQNQRSDALAVVEAPDVAAAVEGGSRKAVLSLNHLDPGNAVLVGLADGLLYPYILLPEYLFYVVVE